MRPTADCVTRAGGITFAVAQAAHLGTRGSGVDQLRPSGHVRRCSAGPYSHLALLLDGALSAQMYEVPEQLPRGARDEHGVSEMLAEHGGWGAPERGDGSGRKEGRKG